MKIITPEEHYQLAEIQKAMAKFLPDQKTFHSEHTRTFLEQASINPTDKEKIAHGNAEKILKLAYLHSREREKVSTSSLNSALF